MLEMLRSVIMNIEYEPLNESLTLFGKFVYVQIGLLLFLKSFPH